LAIELLRRKIQNQLVGKYPVLMRHLRPMFCKILYASGCIAVSGGLETASDQVVATDEKRVVLTTWRKLHVIFPVRGNGPCLSDVWFPTQTIQETIDSLEIVRQLFANN
jgi:hypothetical protein